mmetsp:Transcript_99271/g.262085  ORF Transcript_99271/g.262085 Transcript_99271/m.262085 type:complete len:581 (+) Transcript_99271:85-1827(+)
MAKPADASKAAAPKTAAPARQPGSSDSAQEADAKAREAPKKKSMWRGLLTGGANSMVVLVLFWSVYVANTFRGILWPKFPEMDPVTHSFVTKHQNIFREGDRLKAKLWVDKSAWPNKKPPLAEFEFDYEWEGFKTVSRTVNASITDAQLVKGENMLLSAEVLHEKSGRVVRAKGGLVKAMATPEVRLKYRLLSGAQCPEEPEPGFGNKGTHIARGIPMMQVRLVFDDTAYPTPWARSPWTPPLFVDEFWLTNDQLVKLNHTGANIWESQVQFELMGVARWRFQQHMERSLEQNAKIWGEDSEEMLQMRDLFANTNPYLLVVTLVVSVLHMLFEFLAFKNDVEFFQDCDPETLNKYISVQSIVVGIFMQILLLLYLWDESANLLVLVTSLVGVFVDVWKVQRAMKVEWGKLFGIVPIPTLVSKVNREKADNFDGIAMKWLGLILAPGILGYAGYTLVYDCHRSWYSYFLFVSSSCVYSLGFVLMTPQVFINYKHKSVAYLPWKKFVYRAISTFIDDLFALIIRMPTMHRLSCFRDDIVFFIYLYQRQIYKVDKSRTFDEDGFEITGSVPGEELAKEEKKQK